MVGRRGAEKLAKANESELLVASLGCLSKDDGTVRVLHDATHRVGLNNRCVQRDQARSPGAGEMKVTLDEGRQSHKTVIPSLQASRRRTVHPATRTWSSLGSLARYVLDVYGSTTWAHSVFPQLAISGVARWEYRIGYSFLYLNLVPTSSRYSWQMT